MTERIASRPGRCRRPKPHRECEADPFAAFLDGEPEWHRAALRSGHPGAVAVERLSGEAKPDNAYRWARAKTVLRGG